MKAKKIFAQSYLWLLLILLYAPIAIIALFSFTESRVLGSWNGFSFKLYQNLFNGNVSPSLIHAVDNTLLIGLLSSFISTLLGSIAAVGINNLRGKKKNVISFVNNIPILNPDIITGIALFLLYVAIGVTQGYVTVILAHVSFCTPYVILSIMPKLKQMNPNLYEAAMDLGATPGQAFRKVIVPQIWPGMISGFILSFTLSIDDFAVTLFTKGNQGLETLSTFIYSDARKGGLTPELRPLMTIIFLIILTSLFIYNLRSIKTKK